MVNYYAGDEKVSNGFECGKVSNDGTTYDISVFSAGVIFDGTITS